MAKRRPRPLDTLVVDVIAALAAGKVVVSSIEDEEAPGATIYGCVLPQAQANAIYIDEAANLIDTIVHEAIHAARPEWSEHGVRVQTARLINKLSRRDIEKLYNVYLSKRHVKRRQPLQL